MSYHVGIDVGGTFTDFLVTGADGVRLEHKTASTPDDPARAVTRGLAEIAARLGLGPAEFAGRIATIVHGTTVTTNALLTRSGVRVGLLTTAGFRDVLPMRDGTREAAYDNRLAPPAPLVRREDTEPIGGRLTAAGDQVVPLDEAAVRAAARRFRADGVRAVAISFLHSYRNPSHELRAAQLVREEFPDAHVTRSSDLLPVARYYERTSTAVLNSYVGPIMRAYVTALRDRLDEAGFAGVLLMMQSNGGVCTPEELADRAASSLLSGPASAPSAGLREVADHGLDRCLTIDMGGTSFDAALVRDGRPLVRTDGHFDRWRLALPMVDIHTIGAGGGSIARVEGGILRVGPESAGALPGPACYGRGGIRPTVTDADLLLGYLAPETFVSTGTALDPDAARAAVTRGVARPLGIDPLQAAAGIYDVVNVSMAAGLREVTVRRGHDPRDFPLVIAGGAGPVHAAAIARELSIPLLLVPRESSVFCASGMLTCDFQHDYVRSGHWRLGRLDERWLGRVWRALATDGRRTLASEGVPESRMRFRPSLDLRYRGQWFEINVPLEPGQLARPELGAAAARFHELHEENFGFAAPDSEVEVLNVRVTALGMTGLARQLPAWTDPGRPALTGRRPIWSIGRRRLVDADVFDGDSMRPDDRLRGPAVVEMPGTTIVVPEEYDALVDQAGSFILYARGREDLLDRVRTR